MKLNWIESEHLDIKAEYRHLMPKTYECYDKFTWVDEYGLVKHVTHMVAEMDQYNKEIQNLYIDYIESDRGIDMCKSYSSLEEIEKELLNIKEENV